MAEIFFLFAWHEPGTTSAFVCKGAILSKTGTRSTSGKGVILGKQDSMACLKAEEITSLSI